MVVRVDAVMAGPTSIVASSAGAPPLPASLDVAVHVLQHDDAVVHYPSDRYGEAAEGHEVERKALPAHQNDAGQDTQRYRKSYHHRRAQGVQRPPDGGGPQRHEEREHDHYGEDQPQHGLALQGIYLPLYLRSIVGDGHYFDVRRQIPQVFQSLIQRPRVTSIVLASGSLMTETPRLRLPFVRDMLVTCPAPRDTSATSPSVTGAGGSDCARPG